MQEETRHLVQKATQQQKEEAKLEDGLIRQGNQFFVPGSTTPVMAPELYR